MMLENVLHSRVYIVTWKGTFGMSGWTVRAPEVIKAEMHNVITYHYLYLWQDIPNWQQSSSDCGVFVCIVRGVRRCFWMGGLAMWAAQPTYRRVWGHAS